MIGGASAAAFTRWQASFTRLASAFEGFLSIEFIPAYAGAAEWQIVQRFSRHAALENWLADAERARMLADLAALQDPGGPDLVEEAAPDFHAFAAVTEVITTVVEPGRGAEFRAWVEAMQAAQAGFPGYMGTLVQAPLSPDVPYWTTLVRFASPAELDAWLSSAERKAQLAVADPATSHWTSRRLAAGFGEWFNAAGGAAPPAWKQTALVLMVLFPVVMLEHRFLSPWLTGVPTAAATFIANALSVSLVAWPLVGLARRAMGWWLHPAQKRRRRIEVAGLLVLLLIYGAEMGLLSLLFS